jgi:hypothetical protein
MSKRGDDDKNNSGHGICAEWTDGIRTLKKQPTASRQQMPKDKKARDGFSSDAATAFFLIAYCCNIQGAVSLAV